MTFQHKLKELRIRRGFSQEELARLVGLQKAAIYKYEAGLSVNPKVKVIKKLAEALQVSPIELLCLNDINENTRQIPVLKTFSDISPAYNDQDIADRDVVKDKSIDYALIMPDDSMIGARIIQGDTVYVDRDEEIKNGDIVVVEVDGETLIRRFYKYGNEAILKPENSAMQEQQIKAKDVKLLGKAIEAKIKLM